MWRNKVIFEVSDNLKDVKKIENDNFINLKIWERQHIEEWIRKSPDILGEELLIVSTEFDQFEGSRDRIDILAIDRQGNLVVIEIKRDPYAAYADLQSMRYAAMVSSMTIDKLIPYYIKYQKRFFSQNKIDVEEARNQIIEFVEKDDFEDITNKPRIILCSENFSQEITTTVLWLRQFVVDISCIKFTPYKLENKIVIVPTKIIPLQEAKQYLIDIQKKQEEQASGRRKRQNTIRILIENNLVKEGQKIYLKNALPAYIKYEKNNPIFIATITGKLGQSNSVKWEKDQKEYAISSLTWQIFKDLNPEKQYPGGVNGNWNWMTENDKSLWEIAESFLLKQNKEEKETP